MLVKGLVFSTCFQPLISINYESLIDEVKQYAELNKDIITSVKAFGNIETDRSSGQNIIQSVKSGRGNDGFVGFATKAVIKRELAKV
jgi:hypothetical protein